MPERVIQIDSYECKTGPIPASLIFSEKGDILVSTQFNVINKEYVHYLAGIESVDGKKVFPDLSEIQLFIPKGDIGTTARRLLHDSVLMARLQNEIKSGEICGIKFFAVGSEMCPSEDSVAKVAKKLGLPVLSGSYEVFIRYGRKSRTRELFKELGLNTPEGVENVTKDEILKNWDKFRQYPRQGFWIKADWGAGERRNIYIAPLALAASKEAFDKLSRHYNGKYVLENHISEAVSFPAALTHIDKEHVNILDVHEQTGVGLSTLYKPDKNDQRRYQENPFAGPPRWWSDITVREQFVKGILKVGQKLQQEGWVGMVCIDAIVDADLKIFWDEINFRQGGSSMAVTALRKINNIAPEVPLEDAGISFKVKHFSARRNFNDLIKNLNPEQLVIVNAEYYEKRGFDMVAFKKEGTFEELDTIIDKATIP